MAMHAMLNVKIFYSFYEYRKSLSLLISRKLKISRIILILLIQVFKKERDDQCQTRSFQARALAQQRLPELTYLEKQVFPKAVFPKASYLHSTNTRSIHSSSCLTGLAHGTYVDIFR